MIHATTISAFLRYHYVSSKTMSKPMSTEHETKLPSFDIQYDILFIVYFYHFVSSEFMFFIDTMPFIFNILTANCKMIRGREVR